MFEIFPPPLKCMKFHSFHLKTAFTNELLFQYSKRLQLLHRINLYQMLNFKDFVQLFNIVLSSHYNQLM